jgi:glycosyltransferase involved in cell wall biosynthesis
MRILVANFFPAFHPPRSGGEQRYYWLYHHLSASLDVTLLSPTYSTHPPEVVTYSPTFREHRVPKDPVFDRLHWELDAAGIGPECSAYVVALAAGTDTAFGRRFQELVAHHDVVVHASPFTLPYDRTLGEDGKPRIYDAYNVESQLMAQILRGEAGRTAVAFVRFLEESLVAASSLVLATCEDERRLFVDQFGADPSRTLVVPNGFEPADPAPDHSSATASDTGAPYAVFMGSAHPPNVEAARFLVEQVAPALPDLEFRILGAVCDRLPASVPPNVRPLGFVAEAAKNRELAGCRAALNPLFAGAGTNVKMLDYMAAAAPIVTTAVGARGLDLVDGVDAFLAERDAYTATLREVVAEPVRARIVGQAARRKAFLEYTWAEIAERVHDAVRSIGASTGTAPARAARPLLLVVNDFSIVQATSGGQVRIRELLTELGREFEVVLLCLTDAPRRREHAVAGGVTELAIPKVAAHRDAEAQARTEPAISVDDLVAAEHCAANDELVATFRRLAARAAAVIFEHPFLAPLLDFLPADAPVVYSSLNVERDLKAATLRARSDGARRIAQASALEGRLLDRADLVVCVSEPDRARFRETHPRQRYEVIVSGARVDVRDEANGDGLLGERPFAVFLGSGHPPNIAAAQFLVDVVAPAVPDVTFGIVGSVCGALEATPWPRNVLRFGVLSGAEKDVLLARATLAVNPLFDGGGSSLKVPDFFAAGLPLVSTRVGIRGFDVRDGEHCLIADRAGFASATRVLAADPALRRRLAANARAFCASALDWRVLGARYRRVLRAMIAPAARRKALVVTYRFADPPPGGAEAFLASVLRELDRRGNLTVDVATCDVGAIANRWHFSGRYDPPERFTPAPTYVRALERFPVDPPQLADFGRCARLFAVWMAESRAQAPRLFEDGDPLLLGGWNYPEPHGDGLGRWTSREAQVLVGRRASAIRIAAIAPQATRVEVARGDTPAGAGMVGDRFEWTLDLAGDAAIVTLRVAPGFVAPDDPRELGIFVTEIAVRVGGSWTPVDFADDFAAVARRRAPEAWVRSLVALAERRDRSDDDLFVEVRGPRSQALRRWLEDHVASYDVVLAQGVPFSTPPLVVDVATRQDVPVVVLPHFHTEDRYYHWRRYYDAFRRARRTIAASREQQRLFFDAIGAASVALPGGGVDVAEYDARDLPARQAAFRALHRSSTPFVLVLGRQARSKNTHVVVEAVAAVNAGGHRVDLVLIGPDEDAAAVTAPHAWSYGPQPRDVVLGALSLSLCLATMSDSESFGIVLLESWLSGRPVVAEGRCLAFADLVTPGENGVLASTAADVARAIETYLDDPALAARHGERGRQVAERYSWARLAEGIERVLLEAAAPATADEPGAPAPAPA